ncbi:glycine/betaine ABC transporter [Paenibacillus darwinianus]|uniref:Glycine/betaine ABC transporter n=1 Tax=Paenibacillus darwinianus TaxID=1380763 RepID=A0A9W5S2G8_9BACL|nr:glycine betaine ABC transporter substrate-binding protein [Paenibacillus darwinianus]EXX86015.1 glycine/betaine ABC transporter [Paenibacillus darwinianus]EXX88786.1 glycine/betaine ABC transporter [Paenibacillus darwinianus]EXX89759.1 glycine/betaine ABC transporter [Paenibacillus darwinianus]
MKKWSLLLSAILVAAVLAGCSQKGKEKTINLAYVAWDSEIASTNVVKEVLESKLGYKVKMLQVDAGPMWTGIADGSADAMVAAWLPSTHASYLEQYQSKIDDLGPNLDGTKIGLAVPAYLNIQSIEDLNKAETASSLKNRIIGIEPGAGIMMATEKALTDYALKDYTLVESSSAAMAQELIKAYDNKQPIVVTGWTPHWMFAKMELKYLDDPKGIYGGDEQIHTLVRQGLKDDKQDAYTFLDQFAWEPADMESVMVAIQEGKSPEDAAKDWVSANPDKVDSWIKGTK